MASKDNVIYLAIKKTIMDNNVARPGEEEQDERNSRINRVLEGILQVVRDTRFIARRITESNQVSDLDTFISLIRNPLRQFLNITIDRDNEVIARQAIQTILRVLDNI